MTKKWQPTMSPLFSILILGAACISSLFQIIAFSTHAWAVWTSFSNDNVSSTVFSVETYIGLWYTVECKKGDCQSISHLQSHIGSQKAGDRIKEIQYALRVWSQILVTLALVSSLAASGLSVPFLCNTRRFKRVHLGVTMCSTISFCLLMSVVFNWTSELSANKNVFESLDMIYGFPWSLMFAGFGGAGNGIVAVLHFIVLYLAMTPSPSPPDVFRPESSYLRLMTQTSVMSQMTNDSQLSQVSCNGRSTSEKVIFEEHLEEEDLEQPDLKETGEN